MKKPLILIAGPTASGKTQTSVALAKALNGEIISVDSMQIYRKMDIGTAKVTEEEKEGIPHYMIDEWEPTFECSVATFKERVNSYIEKIYRKGKLPILVGGTGFYINAILYDTEFKENPENDHRYRKFLFEKAQKEGALAIHHLLEQVDLKSAEAIHPNNLKRVIRALEYYHQTGEPISDHNEKERLKKAMDASPYDYVFFVLSMERSLLYERINERIDLMMQRGLLDEVRYFYEHHYNEMLPSMKAIGYKEFFPYFKGEQSLSTCIQTLKQNTKHYAKRQLTWFKHQTSPYFIEVDALHFDKNQILEKMLEIVRYNLKI